ncbi:MAG TPA: hypothetical protein VGQ31_10650 [Candidatus Limnocylindrales bacterium]|nr:hypothetical protein [Candidatus Limnocylindrales bacterium]
MTSGALPPAAPPTSRLAIGGLLVSLAAVAVIVAVDLVLVAHGRLTDVAFSVIPILLITDLSGVGGVLVIRRPGNAIGGLLLFAGVLTAIAWAGGFYSELAELPGFEWIPLVVPVAWLTGWIFTPTIGLIAVIVPMLYPSGHLPGPRWRILAAIALVAISISALATATTPGPIGTSDIMNPVVPPQPLADLIQTLGAISQALALPVILIVIANLVARFGRSRGVEREQMKWFLSVAAMAAVAVVISIVTSGPVSDLFWILAMISVGLLPLAIGIAILRYRLYEIDRLVSRTISYAIITGVLVVVFGALDLVLEALMENLTQADALAVAGSTLIVFMLFQPLRRRVQAAVDRRFDRQRYEGDRIAQEFADRLRDELDPDRLRLELDRVLARTVAPARTGLWLRGERGGRS